MAYCINPQCQDPQNPGDVNTCQSCQSDLSYGQYELQAVEPLLSKKQAPSNRYKMLYRAVDQQGREGILEVLDDAIQPLSTMFRQVCELLRGIQHPGIPQYFDCFTVITPGGKRLNCLFREHIKGVDLQSLLNSQGVVDLEIATDWLKNLCHILQSIHAKGYLHLDIKPANIILRQQGGLALVDFSEGAQSLSAGYSPMEQADGQPQPQSDLYALGRTMVHLLTGHHPLELPKDQTTGTLQWEQCCSPLPPKLAHIINRMMQREIDQRPQSSAEILTQLEQIESPHLGSALRQRLALSHIMLIGSSCFSLIVGFGLALILPDRINPVREAVARLIDPERNLACHKIQSPSFSCGDKSLLPGRANLEDNKAMGLAAYRNQDYDAAVQWFTQAHAQQRADPETIIFRNNALIKRDGLESYTLVVAAPLSVKGLPGYILRGVAQLQTEVNESEAKIEGRSLQILLADDGNTDSTAVSLAKQIVNKQNVVGVVGHYASEISLATLPIYEAAQLPIVSFGSTSKELSCLSPFPCRNNVFYRVVSTTTAEARNLVTYATNQGINERVAVLYNPKSSFSNSLKIEFEAALKTSGGKIVATINPCGQGSFNLDQALVELEQQQVTAIALLPDGQTCHTSLDNTISFANQTQGNYPILNSWTFDSPGIFRRLTPPVLAQTVTGAPWHYLLRPQSQFNQMAETLWGKETLQAQGITGVSATAYDATKVIVEALRQIQSGVSPRLGVLQALRDRSFEVSGETGIIQLLGSDRLNNQLTLLRVSQSPCFGESPALVPLEYDESQTQCDSVSSVRAANLR